jgi:predicted P-loop ATPase/GTPase
MFEALGGICIKKSVDIANIKSQAAKETREKYLRMKEQRVVIESTSNQSVNTMNSQAELKRIAAADVRKKYLLKAVQSAVKQKNNNGFDSMTESMYQAHHDLATIKAKAAQEARKKYLKIVQEKSNVLYVGRLLTLLGPLTKHKSLLEEMKLQ